MAYQRYQKLLDYNWGEKQIYESSKEFLLTKDGHFGKVFRPKLKWTTVSNLTLDIEVKKWENELKKSSSLTKFLYLHLAPRELKNKIRRKLCLDLESFNTSCKNLCDVQQQHGKVVANNFNHLGSPCKNFRGITVCPTHKKEREGS